MAPNKNRGLDHQHLQVRIRKIQSNIAKTEKIYSKTIDKKDRKLLLELLHSYNQELAQESLQLARVEKLITPSKTTITVSRYLLIFWVIISLLGPIIYSAYPETGEKFTFSGVSQVLNSFVLTAMDIAEFSLGIMSGETSVVSFIDPTPANGTTSTNTSLIINVSIVSNNLSEVIYNWNGTNFTLYNDSLLLMMNFDNASAIGDNSTYVIDVSKYGNNGTLSGDATLTSGIFDSGIEFDGSSDYADFSDTIKPSSITISAWIYPKKLGVQQVILERNQGYSLRITSSNYLTGVLKTVNNGWNFVTQSSETISENNWTHVAMTYTSGENILYINGKIVDNDTSYTGALSYVDGQELWIGAWSFGGGGGWFNGTIDEVRIWNRSLSAEEIYQQYVSNLNKHNSSQWYLYVNQSKNATTGLDNGTYTYQAFASDLSGSQNSTDLRTVTIGAASSSVLQNISLIDPTPANATTTTNTSISINISISNFNLSTLTYNWNGTNYTMYNNNMLLLLNFDNISSLGENSTYAVDMTSKGNNATLVNAVINNSGKYHKAVQLDGNGDYLSIPDNTYWDFGTNNLTMSLWANIIAYDASGTFLLEQQSGATYGGFEWYINTGNNILFNSDPYTTLITKAHSPTFGNWSHYAVTRNGTTFTLYQNGVSLGTATSSTALANVTGIVRIGSWVGSANYDFNGRIDEVRIWNRSLSSSEIYEQYISNLNKYNSTQWYLYVNQSKNATAGLDNGTYTYQAFATDLSGSQNSTDLRTYTVSTVSNTAPVASSVNISSSDSLNRTNGTLTGSWAYSDADSDPQAGNETKWYNNSIEVTSLANRTTVGSGNLTKNQNWILSVRVYDGTDWSSWVNSSGLTIQNAAPVTLLANITSDQADFYTNSTLIGWCNASDADVELVSYDTTWYKNSVLYEENIPEYIDAGALHTCGLLTNGSAYCWGYGGSGELGYGGTSNQNNPIAVNISSTFKSISAGGNYYTCGLLTNGSAYCWGSGNFGQLGYGGTTQQNNPIAVNISSTFKSISAGSAHTCGILTNGSAYCWGRGATGRLGYGGTTQQNNPIAVNISSTFKSLSAGDSHTCGILTNGSAYCWGDSSYGQLGYGGTTQQNNPIAVNISSTFKSLSAGDSHTCGLLTNGSAYCWGRSNYGQLGNGGIDNQTNPTAVNISSTFKSLSAGAAHTCSILTNGSAYCWGFGVFGRLGYGGTTQQNNPIAVNISSTFKSLSAGDFHTCGLLTNGSAYCWGYGSYGRLGYGGTSNQNNPIAVNISSTMWPFYTQSLLANIWNITYGLAINDTWALECTANDGTSSSAALNSSIITILSSPNTPPTAPVPLSPINGTHITSRTPTFIWQNSTDADGNSITYNLIVDDNSAFNNPEINVTGIAPTAGPNTTYLAVTELAVDTTYYWKVRANDSTEYGNFSDTTNFTVDSYLSVNLTTSTVAFGSVTRGLSYNTLAGSPAPFQGVNIGNINANISINATSYFTTVDFPSNNYQFKMRTNESDSFNTTTSAMNWTNMSGTSGTTHLANLDWRDVNDDFLMDLNITIPQDDPAGTKSSIVTFSISG